MQILFLQEIVELDTHRCKKCERKFTSAAKMYYHANKVHSSRVHKCSECDYMAKKRAVEKHQKEIHGIYDISSIPCGFFHPKHANFNSDNQKKYYKVVVCIICGANFTTNMAFKTHFNKFHK